ncbi:hypothetical protein O181_031057 [Austropuccinia psidii MF-1]|uniref:Uncharacterized protein n=1 Tax=Austropuccinia psidii MF-1 TaxID=1389203 RepID=A0A9Q3CZW5_9BASI|nr:hypothetical protein [Austropuccinia psidii MF-1]
MAKNHLRTQIGHKSVHCLWKPSEATRPAPSKDSPSSMHSVLKDQEWCIYGIIYHYAPFFLSNPMVTLSEPHYVIPNPVPSLSPLLRKDFSAIQSGNSLAATRRPFKDPNHLALQRLDCDLLSRTIMSAILRVYQSFQSFSRHQVLSIPCTTHLVHTGSNQASWMAWPNWANSYPAVGIQSQSFNSQDGQSFIDPIQTIQPDDSPCRISLSVFHIYWPPFIT